MTTSTSSKGDAAPIRIPGNGAAVLCLHGFTGTPYEIAPLARALGGAGFAVSAPLLAGHGRTASDLAKTRWQDWFSSAESAFDTLRAEAGVASLAVVGFSMGGLLALHLAKQRAAQVSALAILSTPLRLREWQSGLARVLGYLPSLLLRTRLGNMRKRGGSDVTDDKVRDENPSLRQIPVAGVVELVALGDVVRRELADIRCPLLVAHGERDRTVPLAASFELAGSVASEVVERLWLPRSGHLIPVDVERNQLSEAVVRFIRTHNRYPGTSETTP
jgi:carboxylesterase